MKFRKISERVRGGKLDPLSKMGKSKLTGQEVAKYYKDNPKAKMAAKDKTVKKAIELALDLGGSYTQAIKEIEKLKRGLSKMPVVQQALKTANEDMTSTTSVAMPDGIPLGKVKKTKVLKRKDLEEGTKERTKFKMDAIKLMRRVKATNKGHKIAIEDLLTMTSYKVLESMFKRNPRGFIDMLMKMNPKRDKLQIGDYMIDGRFVASNGNVLSVDQTKKLTEDTSLDEDTMTYRVKDIQKPEMDKFTSSSKLMKLKMQVKRSPRGKETLITMSGNKKQLRDFDAVARGKSSYGDPSLIEDAVERAKEMADLKAKHKREAEQEKDEIQRTKDTATEDVLAQLNSLEEQLDLLEKQYAVKGGETDFSKRNRLRRTKSSSGKYMSKDDIVAKLRKLPDGSNKVKDSNNSLIVRSLARLMNTERRPAAKKGVAFGKGKGPDEMDAPKIKKIIDIVSKGMSITKTGNKLMRNKKELAAFSDLDTYTRDEVADIILKASDGILYSLVYEGTELNEESATMKKVRQVVKKKGMMNIDGMKLDLTTASMISSVYDKVNSQNKKRMDKLKLPQLVNLTMKVAGKSRKESTDLQEVTRQEVDAMKKVSKDMQKVLQTYQKIATIGDKELKDTRHNKDYKKVLDARDSILKMIGTLNTKMSMQKEAVSPAQQAAIAISKKERGEKPKKEALDAKDKPFVKDLVKKLRGGSKTHAKQADDLEKAINTESMSRAKADAMRDMGKRKDKDDDGYGVATKDDRKAADKNVVMQIRKVTDLQRPAQIELRNGKKVMLKPADAKMMMKKFDAIRKPQDRLKVQNAMNDKKMTVQGLKRLLGK